MLTGLACKVTNFPKGVSFVKGKLAVGSKRHFGGLLCCFFDIVFVLLRALCNRVSHEVAIEEMRSFFSAEEIISFSLRVY